jgi:hypothetical protein
MPLVLAPPLPWIPLVLASPLPWIPVVLAPAGLADAGADNPASTMMARPDPAIRRRRQAPCFRVLMDPWRIEDPLAQQSLHTVSTS